MIWLMVLANIAFEKDFDNKQTALEINTIQYIVSQERLVCHPDYSVNVILGGCRLVLVRIEANLPIVIIIKTRRVLIKRRFQSTHHFQRFRQLLLYLRAESLSLHDVRF